MKRVLHFLCGAKGRPLHAFFNTKEWEEVRLDLRPDVKPSIVCHWRELDRLEQGSYDGIWSGFGLNRIPQRDIPKLLKDWYRLLRPDGRVVICVSNVRKLGELAYKNGWDEKEGEGLSPNEWWYGDPGRLGLPLRSGFSSSSLAKAFAKAGFTEVEVKVLGPQLVLAASREKRDGPPRMSIREEDVNAMMLARDRLDQPPKVSVTYP